MKMQASNSILNPLSPWHVPGTHTACFSPAPIGCYNLSFLPTAVKQGLKMETSSCPSGVCSKMSEMLLTGFITRWLQEPETSVVLNESEGLVCNSSVKIC